MEVYLHDPYAYMAYTAAVLHLFLVIIISRKQKKFFFGLSLRWSGLNPRTVHVGFVLDKVEMG
jgi:hypothetical protein